VKNLSRRSILMMLAVGPAIADALPSAAQTAPKLKVAVVPSDVAAQAYYAGDLGYFQDAGLSVEIIPMQNGPAIVAAVASGAVDIGYSNLLSIAVAHEKGLSVTILAGANLSDSKAPSVGILAVTKSSPIRTAKDLNGKTIAVDGLNTIAQLGVRNWMDKNGGDSTSAHFVELPFGQMPEALVQGRVDAASMNQVADPALGKPDDPLRLLGNTFDAVAPRFAFGVWFSTKDWAAKNRDLVQRFATAMRRAGAWGNAHHQESAAILAKYLKQSPQQINAVNRAVYGAEFDPRLAQPPLDLALRYGALRAPLQAKELMATP
jgi:NitT/TauT family transport system substrate-binding protein